MAPSPIIAVLPFGGSVLAWDNPGPTISPPPRGSRAGLGTLGASTRCPAASPGERVWFQRLGQGEINGTLWFGSQLSVGRSCSPFGVHSAAAPMEPGDGLIQLFRFIPTRDFYQFIANHFI